MTDVPVPATAGEVMLHPDEVGYLAVRIQTIARAILDDLDRAGREPALTSEDFGNLDADAQAYRLHAQLVLDSSAKAREHSSALDESADGLAKYATAMQDQEIATAARLDAIRHGG